MYVDLVRSLLRRRDVPRTVDRYLSRLSKHVALIETESASVLRNDPVFTASEAELSRLAPSVDGHHLDDPFIRRASTDGGHGGGVRSFDPLP
jgi:hypothetical protein